MQSLDVDYLVVGAGASGMAFTDALIDHADVRVALIDRRSGAGGHWLDAYPFVRLHQASSFYGVASTLLGEGRLQEDGPEAGLHERATAAEIRAYYERVLTERMLPSGKVSFHPGCDHLGGRRFVSRVTGEEYEVSERARVVDARYLAPEIPFTSAAPFEVADGVESVLVNDLVNVAGAPSQFVIVGAGKTATDACVWLLEQGVSPDAICWVRPRDAWMFNRAVLQPDPVVFLGMAADVMESAARSATPDELFLHLEAAGVMLRIDPAVTPTMAKTPTLAQWELDKLRTIENVVRLGHLRRVERDRLVLSGGEAPIASDAVVVHCAAPGMQYPPLVPIWQQDAIRLQPTRSGFPCFGAAMAGYVEATLGSDEDKNRYCQPSPYSNTPDDWPRMQVLGNLSALTFSSHPDLRAWADQVHLNPNRVPPEMAGSPELAAVKERFRAAARPGMTRMAEFAGLA